MERRIFLYGFDELHHVICCKYIREGRMSINAMKWVSEYMVDEKPNIERIYAMDDRDGLKQDFLDTITRPHFTKDIEFEDLISREGILIFKR